MLGKVRKILGVGSSSSSRKGADKEIEQESGAQQPTTSTEDATNLASQFQRASTLNVDEFLHPLMRKHKLLVTMVKNEELLSMVRIWNSGKLEINQILDSVSQLKPIHLVAMLHKADILESLLRFNGIEVNAQTRDGDTPLLLALKTCGSLAREQKACLKVVKVLMKDERCQLGCVNNVGASPLSVAVAKNFVGIVHELVVANSFGVYGPADLVMAIKLAFIHGREELADMIFSEMDADSGRKVLELMEVTDPSVARHLQLETRSTRDSMATRTLTQHPPNSVDRPQSSSRQHSQAAEACVPPEQDNLPPLVPFRHSVEGRNSISSSGRRQASRRNTQTSQDFGYTSGSVHSSSSLAAVLRARSSVSSLFSIYSGNSTISHDGLQLIRRQDLEIKRRLGSGGFGQVAAGSWRGADCAIKQIRPILTADIDYDEILKEARIQYDLKHPNIVALYGISYDRDLWMVMQFVDGVDLHSILFGKSKETIGYSFKLKISVQATNVISYMHDMGLVHNDIKPENIMIERRTGNVLVCDFGITRYVGRLNMHNYSRKYSKAFRGTLPYIAPECYQKDAQHGYLCPTFKSDVWAMGAVLIELFTERELFPEDNLEMALFQCKILKDYSGVKAILAQVVDLRIQSLLGQAIDPEPDRRPTVEQMRKLLYQIERQKQKT